MSDTPPPVSEREAAERMAAGKLPSPSVFGGNTLFSLRVTGCGFAHRSSHDEWCYRPPELFLSQPFLDMVSGCPVVVDHPEGAVLNGRELSDRCIGTLLLGFVQGAEVWAIGKIIDADAASAMRTIQFSTSPCVTAGPDNRQLKIGDVQILVESLPASLDHLALVENGVWDKGAPPSGVLLTTEATMPEDQMQVLMGKLADSLGAIGEKLDALTTRVDGMESAAKPPKADADKPAKADAGEERAKMAEAQARADGVSSAFGSSAPRPLDGESSLGYRRRLLRPFLSYSKTFSDLDVADVADPILRGVETSVFADAMAAAEHPIVVGENLVMRETRDQSGRTIRTFHGHPRAWMSQFRMQPRRVVKFDKNHPSG